MKTNHLLIILVFFAALLPGCITQETSVSEVPNEVQADNLTGLKDCESQLKNNETEYIAECSVLTALLDEQVKQQDILGMVMAVRLADGTVIWDTSGYVDPNGNERWRANTPSLIGSITKTFTAVVVMQLVEEGKLSLDDTVDTWFPEQPDGDKITVRMLLSHTSGLTDYQKLFEMDPEKFTREWAPEELIAIANQAGSVGVPGSSTAYYSSTNYIMLGRIIEKVTGNSWEHEIESLIIQPLDLKDTILTKADIWNIGMVPGYVKTSDSYKNILEDPFYSQVSESVAWAAGGIASSASDLMTFASALFDGRLVSKETLGIMAQPVGTGDGWTWGLGGGVMKINDHQSFAMGGDSTGYHAFFIGTLDGKFIITALVNTDGDVISPSMDALKSIIQQNESK